MTWCVGWLLVGVWAWTGGSVPRPPLHPVLLGCDVEALRCDVICSFPDLGLHCSRCDRRRPMRFGKRGGDKGIGMGLALPPASWAAAADGASDPSADALGPAQAEKIVGLSFVGRPHVYLSKIFWRNTVGQNFPSSQEGGNLRPWGDRKRCSLSGDDPTKCSQETVFRKLFRSGGEHGPSSEEESSTYLCDVEPRRCPDGIASFSKNFDRIDSPPKRSLNSDNFNKRFHNITSHKKRIRNWDISNRNNEKLKRRWRSTDKPASRVHPHQDDNPSTERRHSSGLSRRSRRSVVEEVVEGLMEMLDLEVLPVNPKHYGCNDLPFPGLE